eukprot:1087567-Prymnesium_polylepis.1
MAAEVPARGRGGCGTVARGSILSVSGRHCKGVARAGAAGSGHVQRRVCVRVRVHLLASACGVADAVMRLVCRPRESASLSPRRAGGAGVAHY